MNVSATETLTTLVTEAMRPHARAGGYRKQRLTYHRRRGDTTQIVNFQLSQGNSHAEARSYVNVAVAPDALFALAGRAVPAALKEYECPFRVRLEQLVPDAPPAWIWDASCDAAAWSSALGACLERMADWLDGIDSPATLLHRATLERGANLFLRAQLHYVLGDLDAALADVQAGVAAFADRGMTVEKQLAALHLTPLRARMQTGATAP